MIPRERLWIPVVLGSLGVLITGLISNVYLGDEIYHYRFAKDIFTAGKRVTFDPLYGENFTSQTYYLIPPLWHILLAFLWKITGGISHYVAQIYQAFFYAFLLFLTHRVGREIYGEDEGFHSVILVGTVPMVASFGILLYLDLPLATLTFLTFLLILKERFFLGGLGFGLMYFTKFNGLLFGLPFLLLILFRNDGKRSLIKVLSFSLAAFLIIAPDIYWREKHPYGETRLGTMQGILSTIVLPKKVVTSIKRIFTNEPSEGSKFSRQERLSIVLEGMRGVKSVNEVCREYGISQTQYYHWQKIFLESDDVALASDYSKGEVPTGASKTVIRKLPRKKTTFYRATFLSLRDHIKYFGLVLLGLLVFYVIRRRFERRDLLLWVPVLLYLLGLAYFIYFGKLDADMRHLLPVVPFLCVVASKISVVWKNKKFLIGCLLLCSIQFLGVLAFVLVERRITPEMREGMKYIKGNLPENAIILYPEYNLTEYTDRRIAWTTNFWNLRKVLWGPDEFIKDSLIRHKVHYILVKKTRIYDDTEVSHLGGYPISFVNRLPKLGYLELTFENETLALWRLKDEEISKAGK